MILTKFFEFPVGGVSARCLCFSGSLEICGSYHGSCFARNGWEKGADAMNKLNLFAKSGSLSFTMQFSGRILQAWPDRSCKQGQEHLVYKTWDPLNGDTSSAKFVQMWESFIVPNLAVASFACDSHTSPIHQSRHPSLRL